MHNKNYNLAIVHSAPSFIVVEKPGGLLSVPGRSAENQDSVVTRVKAKYPGCIDQPAVHRLDMFTTGLMVLALTAEAHRCLSRQFEKKIVQKRYIAVLEGVIGEDGGEIMLCFRLDPNNRPYQIYDPLLGKNGITHWKKISTAGGTTRVEFTPLTGRTHQLRLHAAHASGLGCPIIGDRLYGHGQEGDQMLLHASYLSFLHPLTGKRIHFNSPPSF